MCHRRDRTLLARPAPPVQSSPGQIADRPSCYLVIRLRLQHTSPFPIGTFVDNAFLTPTGNRSAFFEMTGVVNLGEHVRR